MSEMSVNRGHKIFRSSLILLAMTIGLTGFFVASCSVFGAARSTGGLKELWRERPWHLAVVSTVVLGALALPYWSRKIRWLLTTFHDEPRLSKRFWLLRVQEELLLSVSLFVFLLGLFAGMFLRDTIPSYGNYPWHKCVRVLLIKMSGPELCLIVLGFYAFYFYLVKDTLRSLTTLMREQSTSPTSIQRFSG
jgi:hypothetical protein